MDELTHHLNQLPDFLHSEVSHHAGNTDGQPPAHVVERYINATHHLMTSKRVPLRQEYIDNITFMWGDTRSSKQDMENRALLRNMPGGRQTDFFSMTIDADFHMQSIRFLGEFKISLESLLARLKEHERQHAERMAQEAAQRQAEEEARARAEVEEAARRLAEEQAAQQRAIEAAFQLAQRQVEEAEHALALRNAEEARAKEAESNRAIEMTLGPEASREIDNAIKVLRGTIEIAITDFSNTISAHGALDMSQLEAIQNMSAVH
ncbi:hypothetical protein [Pseudomonas syringae]|uniref:hypothetical protein n=1 Tax=Pseudomonas syringae TaxID=317 RepID=UPI0018E5E526|nr:hypothetical protein [Pseudomonas syringae]MBI6818276.1 hypothetical protein [Pseudomonas syringae]MBI6823246.1 hypothetical protein [Pseudomonas syringae]